MKNKGVLLLNSELIRLQTAISQHKLSNEYEHQDWRDAEIKKLEQDVNEIIECISIINVWDDNMNAKQEVEQVVNEGERE